MTDLPLFVFGTLRRGQCNHHLLQGRCARILPARLPGFAKIHPLMIVRRDGDAVDGELCFLSPPSRHSTLRNCDELESIPPGQTAGPLYARIEVDVDTAEGRFRAWAYVHPESAHPESAV